MPGPGLGFNAIAGPEWERVIAALGRANDEMPEQLIESIEDDAEDLAKVARGRVLGLPTPRNAGHTGLRKKVAAGVHVERHAFGVRVQTSMPTSSESIIPRGLDRPKGWRHPLFGDRDRWFSNPGYDWFVSTFENSDDYIEGHLHDVLVRAAEKVAEAGE